LLKEGKLDGASESLSPAKVHAVSPEQNTSPNSEALNPATGRHAPSLSNSSVPPASANPALALDVQACAPTGSIFRNLQDIASHASAEGDAILCNQIETMMRLVKFDQGAIAFNPTEQAPSDLAGRLAQKLKLWTGQRWIVSVNARETGDNTLRSVREQQVLDHPLVKAALSLFPDIDPKRDVIIRKINPLGDEPGTEALDSDE